MMGCQLTVNDVCQGHNLDLAFVFGGTGARAACRGNLQSVMDPKARERLCDPTANQKVTTMIQHQGQKLSL